MGLAYHIYSPMPIRFAQELFSTSYQGGGKPGPGNNTCLTQKNEMHPMYHTHCRSEPRLDIIQCYPTEAAFIPRTPLASRVLTHTAGTPPGPDVHRLLSSHWTRGVVMHVVFVDGYINRTVLRDEREVREEDGMELIEGILAHSRVGRPQFLLEKRIQRMVAVEGEVSTAIVIGSRRNLVTRQIRGVITVVGVCLLKLRQLILFRVTLRQDVAKEGTCWIVLDVDLDADGLEVRLQDQLVGGAPGIF